MRLAGIVPALICGLVACGGARAPDVADPVNEDGPFGAAKDFKPKAFSVEVSGSGRPIIFIPGLGCPGEVWQGTVEHLGDEYESHVLTLSGFAGTKPIKEPLSAAVRRDLTRYIRSKKLVDPVIVGHSMGGFIAFWIASNMPEVVGPIIIVDAGPALSGDIDDAKAFRERWAGADDVEFARQAKYMYQGMARNKKRLEPIAALAAKSDRRTLGDAIYEMIITDLTEQTAEIKSPVLVILADGGLQQRFRSQSENIPNKEIVVIPKTGHFVMIDDPEGFFGALDQFLEDHPPKT
jgi:N-formylmaleamate deformylase